MPITKTKNKKDGLQQYRVRINYIDQFGKPHNRAKLIYGLTEAKQAEKDLKVLFCAVLQLPIYVLQNRINKRLMAVLHFVTIR